MVQQLPTYGGPTMLEVVVSVLASACVQINAATPKKCNNMQQGARCLNIQCTL